jgi:hypothetical protein
MYAASGTGEGPAAAGDDTATGHADDGDDRVAKPA